MNLVDTLEKASQVYEDKFEREFKKILNVEWNPNIPKVPGMDLNRGGQVLTFEEYTKLERYYYSYIEEKVALKRIFTNFKTLCLDIDLYYKLTKESGLYRIYDAKDDIYYIEQATAYKYYKQVSELESQIEYLDKGNNILASVLKNNRFNYNIDTTINNSIREKLQDIEKSSNLIADEKTDTGLFIFCLIIFAAFAIFTFDNGDFSLKESKWNILGWLLNLVFAGIIDVILFFILRFTVGIVVSSIAKSSIYEERKKTFLLDEEKSYRNLLKNNISKLTLLKSDLKTIKKQLLPTFFPRNVIVSSSQISNSLPLHISVVKPNNENTRKKIVDILSIIQQTAHKKVLTVSTLAAPGAILIKANDTNIKELIERVERPLNIDPGIVLEFKHVVLIIPETFYNLEPMEADFLKKALQIAENWEIRKFLNN